LFCPKSPKVAIKERLRMAAIREIFFAFMGVPPEVYSECTIKDFGFPGSTGF
jgi:hypothetical protein